VREGTPSFALKEMAEARYRLDEVCWEHEIEENASGPVVRFRYHTADGLIFTKRFTFYQGAFHVDVGIEVENLVADRDEKLKFIFEGPCGITSRNRASFTAGPAGALCTQPREQGKAELETLDAKKLKGSKYEWSRRADTTLVFAGVTNNYFALLLQPLEGRMISKVSFNALEDTELVAPKVEEYKKQHGAPPPAQRLNEFREDALDNVRMDTLLTIKIPPPGEREQQTFLFFAGPKLSSLMKRPEYSEFYVLITASYGIVSLFNWINPCIIWILALFHSIFGNWGVAIICLTIVVKALLFPLNRIQQTSMLGYSEKMKRLKPKLEELKKKFKNNKKKFNEAQMALMKEEGVRPPLMGCMLMLLQFPIFIGLFQVLRTSFELRHSPFCLWIQDLSQPDALPLPFSLPLIGNHINLVPILMTVAFYYQQKVMPKPESADPQAQQMQKMMKFMPFLFLFILYGYASGLSLYWMTSNLISIFEYKFIRKKFPVGPKPEEVPARKGPGKKK
jgi:YidC/Oxa1 family membrane protein insertase